MTARARRAERPIAPPTSLAVQMASSQEQQRALTKRAASSDEDENNNRPRVAPSLVATRQPHKSNRSHCSSLNLSSSSSNSGGAGSLQKPVHRVTQSAKAAQPIGGVGSNLRQPASPAAGASLRAQSKKCAAPTSSEPRKPLAQVNRLRWKSSTSALNCKSGASPRWQSATKGGATSQHSSAQQVSSKGQWCCELPHHATGAHLNTRRQSNLAPLLNRVHHHQDLSGLRNTKRAASSLSLASARPPPIRPADKVAPWSRSIVADSRSATGVISAGCRTTASKTSDKSQAISSRLEQVQQASSQVTNSRLRQGALFARRQLHLLPAQTLASRPPPTRLESRHAAATRCARAQSVAPQIGRAGPNKVQANLTALGKPSTATEARRRATRQVLVVAAPRAPLGAQNQPFKLVKAEKKSSHLSSSSSSLSLSAFVVKRPRQQQHSSTSSSCSSISTASRRWSSSSGAESSSSSQSCSQLTRAIQGDWPLSCNEEAPSLVGSNKTTSANFEPTRGRANAPQTPTDEPLKDQRTRSLSATTNGQLERHPKQQANHLGPEQQDFDNQQSVKLLGSTPIGDTGRKTISSNPSDISQGRTTASEGGASAANRHAFLVQSDVKKPIEQQVNLDATIESSRLEDADIVALGCLPAIASVLAPQSAPSTKDNFSNSQETSQLLPPHNTMATTATGCNTNENEPIVTSNNHEAENVRFDNHMGVLEKNIDMQISSDIGRDVLEAGGLENINNNIDVYSAQQEASNLNKRLISPLDLSSKTFGRNIVSQEPSPSSPLALKNQPLGSHQSMNISASNEQLAQSHRQGNAFNEHFCPIDLTIVQADQTTKPISNIRASPEESPSGQDATVEQQKMAEIPIRLEPISDFYDLESRPFARGKFAQVKRCTRKSPMPTMSMGECYAAKCIKKRRRLVDIKHEILLEIEALKLSYVTDHIVRLYEVYETQNEMVLVLEMAKGGELQRVLDDEEHIEESLVRKMIDQILEGLIHLHDNEIAHLDIKPQNLLLSKPFPDGDIKLCDFGISRRITKDCEIREICGTPDYVAPEILRYDPISLATDMWSLGVLTYVLLSGYSPFGSDNKQQTFCNITQASLDFPQDIFAKISIEAVDFVRKLIVREPAERLTSREAKQHHWISNRRIG